MRESLTKILGMYDALENAWSPIDKAQIAQSMLAEFIKIVECQQGQITLLQSRLDGIQHGKKGAAHG